MRLALATGRLDVDAVLASLSSRQLAEWDAFERIEGGFGDRAAWDRMANMLALYAEVNRDKKKRTQPFKASEFMPWIERPAGAGTKRLRAGLTALAKQRKR